MTTYERVTFRDHGGRRSRTVYLRDAVECEFLGHPVLRGFEVNVQGDDVATGRADDRLRIIQADLVVARRPMVMSRKYAELVAEDA